MERVVQQFRNFDEAAAGREYYARLIARGPAARFRGNSRPVDEVQTMILNKDWRGFIESSNSGAVLLSVHMG